MALILGVETSGQAGSVALSWRDDVLGTRTLQTAGRRHAQTLLSECRTLLSSHQKTPQDLDAVAVTSGPGSFTGLRVGVVCGKTLAYALQIPLILLDTFDLIAAQCPPELRSVWIVDDAQRQELFVGRYKRGDLHLPWILSGDRSIVPASSWLQERSADDVIAGPGVEKILGMATLAQVQPDPAVRQPRAETVCRLAWDRYESKEFADPWTAAPFYVRVSAAEEKAAKAQ